MLGSKDSQPVAVNISSPAIHNGNIYKSAGNSNQISHKTNNRNVDNNYVQYKRHSIQDQNIDLNSTFCIPNGTMSQISTPNSDSGTNGRRTQWRSNGNNTCNRNFRQGFANEGIDRYRYSYFNGNGCDNPNSRSSMFPNTVPLNPHNSTNGFNRTKYYHTNHKKIRRHSNIPYTDDVQKRAFGLMERFKPIAKSFRIEASLPTIGKSDPTPLDKDIWDLFVAKAQSEEGFMNKLILWQKAYIHIAKLFNRYALFMVGSTMSGLATERSDLDMCLLQRSVAVDPRHEAVNNLEEIRKSLLNCDFVQSVDLIQAKVPILKFIGLENGFVVDLNYNNSVGIRNTHLLSCYVQLDWRVRPLVIIVKLWAQANAINDAKHMTISSYSLSLMVIHYLQCGTNPTLLPCLHSMYPEAFKPDKDIHDIVLDEKLPEFFSYNQQPLGELLIGFLRYYADFNYETDAISVRLGSRVAIEKCRYAHSPKNDIHQWKLLCIEEPFDLTNTARSVYDLDTFRRIKHIFQEASRTLLETGDLESILNTKENQR